MRALSGGNKQKVNLGRWLIKDLDVLIVDCPTRGVDIGVKAYIYQCLREAKEKGMAILLITDELSESWHGRHHRRHEGRQNLQAPPTQRRADLKRPL